MQACATYRKHWNLLLEGLSLPLTVSPHLLVAARRHKAALPGSSSSMVWMTVLVPQAGEVWPVMGCTRGRQSWESVAAAQSEWLKAQPEQEASQGNISPAFLQQLGWFLGRKHF